jgi:hypothetical protein
MLDYYGSILKSEKEIDRELCRKFRDRCYESYMKKVIRDLRKEEVLYKEYSYSGWLIFHSQTIYEIIEKTINYQKQKNEKRMKFLYCYNQLFEDTDVLRVICDKI